MTTAPVAAANLTDLLAHALPTFQVSNGPTIVENPRDDDGFARRLLVAWNEDRPGIEMDVTRPALTGAHRETYRINCFAYIEHGESDVTDAREQLWAAYADAVEALRRDHTLEDAVMTATPALVDFDQQLFAEGGTVVRLDFTVYVDAFDSGS